MHIDSIALITKRIPTVAKQVFIHCLSGETSNNEGATMNPGHEHLEMLRSVYLALGSKHAAKSLAIAVLELTSPSPTQSHSKVIRLVVNALGKHFDAFVFTECIIKAKTGVCKTITNAHDSARLIFDCAILAGFSDSSDPKLNLESKMLSLRKELLRWCVSDLAPVYCRKICQEESTRCNDSYDGRGAVVRGPGESDYCSYLDPKSVEESVHLERYKFVLVVKSLLFLNRPESREIKSFLRRDFDTEEKECISFCCDYTDIDDELLEIVIDSPSESVTPTTAIALIEVLVLGCKTALDIPVSSQVVSKLYERVIFFPQFHSNNSSNIDDFELPRLAHSGLWWRVTAITLVMCSLSSNVGKTMWTENPTLRALIKMSTSQKFRFPTADCDSFARESVRVEDANAREREAKIAELLFTAPKPKTAFTDPKPSSPIQRAADHRQGLRSSARQREKRDRIIAHEQERIAAARHAEQMRIRRQLKLLQKGIMIWDPTQPQRKPPKESIDLILSINHSFNLAEKFRSSTEPIDYLLQTIGDGRSAIERAYDWLIPIISQSSKVIHRLQPSSSCFLLLRAYGAEAAGKNKELIDLSTPLLSHVSCCLNGEYGESHSLMALELLLMDIADENADRRRCARKVLQQALPSHLAFGWLNRLMDSPNAKALVPLTMKYLVSSRWCEHYLYLVSI
jgi:integrator complex subunit 1